MDRYCDYHQEKGHHKNDCFQLRKQLETTLESGKLNHLIRDVRQRGRGNQRGEGPQQAKIINIIRARSLKEKKRKAQEVTEEWMNTPITFPPVLTKDVSDKPLIMKAEVEVYLVRRIYVDGGASVEVVFEHCYEKLSSEIKARLRQTQTDLVGFFREATKPLGKIELEVCFGSEGLCRRTILKFTLIRAPLTYDIILRMAGLRKLWAIPSTIHSMMKFPTSKGIATLVTRSVIILECRHLEKKQVVEEEEKKEEIEMETLKLLLKNNEDVFSWDPADTTRVPRKVIEYNLNVKKSNGAWRMCIDFTNLNLACPKDYYLLPNIDYKVESVMGFKYECFLDAYKGYHQIQMLKEDEEKTTFYTDQGTRILNKAERNYSPMEKLALSLVHMTRRLGWYFEAYPMKVIIDQLINQILSKTESLGKLAKYTVELGAYNITLKPRNTMKDQVLVEFITKTPDEESPELYFQIPERDDTKEWTLFTDGAFSPKGSSAGLVFFDTKNEAEYEALLTGLRIAKKINI
nr:reverse transcriptase domain-containing protein [Tanacetum cinerariifolium]